MSLVQTVFLLVCGDLNVPGADSIPWCVYRPYKPYTDIILYSLWRLYKPYVDSIPFGE